MVKVNNRQPLKLPNTYNNKKFFNTVIPKDEDEEINIDPLFLDIKDYFEKINESLNDDDKK